MRLSEKIQNGSTSSFLNSLNEAAQLKEERKYRNPKSDPKAEDNFIHTEYKYQEPEPEKEEVKEEKECLKEAEEGASIFELKFDCSNEETFGIGEDLIDPIANTLKNVIEKIEVGKLDGPIMDVNGNKIGSFGIGYEGVQSGLDEECNTKLKEDESKSKYKVGDIVKVPYKYGTYTPGEFTEAPIIDIEDGDFVTVEIPSKLTVMMDQIERWNNLEECDTKLEEKYVESFGGDTKDFISEVETIKAKLEEIDTDGFGAKLSQQMVWDWIEACDRLLEKANRLDSGDEFGTK